MSPDGQIISFGRLDELVSSFSQHLTKAGITAGQCVSLATDNSVIRAGLAFALLRLGADVAMPSPGAIANAGISVDAVIRFADQTSDSDTRSIVFTQDWLIDTGATVPAAAQEGHLIFGTSGSTGLPKLIRFRADRLLHTLKHHVEGSGVSLGPVLVGIPETTMFGFYLMLRAFLRGHGIMWMRGDPATILEQATRLGVVEFMVTPLAVADLVTAVENGAPTPYVQRICLFGAITAQSLFARVEAAFHAPMAIKLGTSETGQTSYGLIDGRSYVAGWSGRPISTVEVRIDSDEPGGSGRMSVRESPRIGTEGYLGGEPMFDADGWFDTGDVARILPDGNLMIEGRADNLLNLGGSKFAAELVEMLATGTLGVREAVAVLLPETRNGTPELGVAVVADADFDPAALKSALALKLRSRASIRIVSVAALPRLPSLKIDRRAAIGLF